MTGPFPARIRVPVGLVRRRLVWGMPTSIVSILVLLFLGPLLLFGRQSLWLSPLVLLAGLWLAVQSRYDPDFLRTWAGEMRLKHRYY